MHHSDFDAHQALTPRNPTEVYSPHLVVLPNPPRQLTYRWTCWHCGQHYTDRLTYLTHMESAHVRF